MDNRAIGVFDSGLGGLTAVKEIIRLLPQEKVVYFGDTARVPYGSHDRETIIKFSRQDLSFLLSKDVKTVLIACGTASSTALGVLRKETDVPIFGVVDPAVRAAMAATRNGRIAILATHATIKSHAYGDRIKAASPRLETLEVACPLFVPLVENGYIAPGDPITSLVAAEYARKVFEFGADTVILGCTHYPIIRECIARQLPHVTLIEAGQEAVRELKAYLDENGLHAENGTGERSYYASETVEQFVSIGRIFLNNEDFSNAKQIDIDSF